MLSSSLVLYPVNCRSDRVYCSPMSASLLHASRMLQQRIFSPFAARLLAPTCKPTQPLQLQCLKNCHAVHSGSAAAQNSHRSIGYSSQATEHASIYSSPDLYDRAFSFREFDEEVQFLETILLSCVGTNKGAFLELGCGPARHTSLLQNKTGFQASALDNSQAMLAYAEEIAQQAGATVNFIHGDMRYFQLEEKVDMVFMLLGTFAHLLDTTSALQCLHSIHAALKPDGVLVLELAHPAEAFDGSLLQEDSWSEGGDEPQDRGVPGELAVQYGKSGDKFDAIEQVLQRTVTVYRADSTGTMQEVIKDTVPQRIVTYQEMGMLALSTGFALHAAYGDMQIDIPIADEDATRMVVVLKLL